MNKNNSFELPNLVEKTLIQLHHRNQNSQREWVCGKEGQVYVRVTQRFGLENRIVSTFELATIEIDEAFQNQGVFKSVLDVFEKIGDLHQRYVFIENILNPHILKTVQKRGYEPDPQLPLSLFWKRPSLVLEPKKKMNF